MHNGGAYGDGTTEINVGFGFGTARTAGKLGQLTLSSVRPGASSQDYFVERLWEERPRDCPATGDEQEHGRPVATTVQSRMVGSLDSSNQAVDSSFWLLVLNGEVGDFSGLASMGYRLRTKTSAGSLNRALSFRICSNVIFRCLARNMETALSEPNSGTRSRWVRF